MSPAILVRSELCEEIADALTSLWARERPDDETIHEVRKDLKRARADLRLLREAVGEEVYHEENARLRDAARPLSPVRDAAAMLATTEALLEGERKPARRGALLALARELRAERDEQRERLVRSRRLPEVQDALVTAGERVEDWRMPRDALAVLRAGVKRVYRKGRKALKKARAAPSDELLHETRKQAKYLRQAIEALEPGTERKLAKLAKRAEAVADGLGDDHDLAVLEGRLDDGKLRKRIASRREKLQKKALKKARRLYRKKPSAFAARVLP